MNVLYKSYGVNIKANKIDIFTLVLRTRKQYFTTVENLKINKYCA